jgi:hypothetical protein
MPSKTEWLHSAVVTLVFLPLPPALMHLRTLQLLKYPCKSSFHTQHVGAARKIISDGLLLMLERFGICLLRLCIRRDGERQAFVENV